MLALRFANKLLTQVEPNVTVCAVVSRVPASSTRLTEMAEVPVAEIALGAILRTPLEKLVPLPVPIRTVVIVGVPEELIVTEPLAVFVTESTVMLALIESLS